MTALRGAGEHLDCAFTVLGDRIITSFSRIAFAAALLAMPAPTLAQPKAGDAAPNFTLRMFDGSKRTLADYRGKVLVINYWATWCGPCKSEMPMMSGFHRRFQASGFEIVGVVTQDSAPKPMLKRVVSALSYSLASDLKGGYGPIGDAVPTNYVIDRKGRVRFAKAGAFTAEEFTSLVIPLLNEPA